MATALDELLTEDAEATRKAIGSYRALVRMIGDEKPFQTDTARTVMAAAGKSATDLEKAVEIYRRRKAWAAEIREAEKAANQSPELRRKFDAAFAVFEKAKADFHAIVDPIQWAFQQIADLNGNAKSAERELARTCDDPAISTECASIERRLNQLRLKRAAVDDQLQRAKINTTTDGTDSAPRGIGEQERKRHADHAREAVKQFADEIAKIDAEAAKLVSRSNELHKLKFIP